jgi:hypothetical protein
LFVALAGPTDDYRYSDLGREVTLTQLPKAENTVETVDGCLGSELRDTRCSVAGFGGGAGYGACDFRATRYIFRLFSTQLGCCNRELSCIGFQAVTVCVAEMMVFFVSYTVYDIKVCFTVFQKRAPSILIH